MRSQLQYRHVLQLLPKQHGAGHMILILCLCKPCNSLKTAPRAHGPETCLLQITRNLLCPVIPVLCDQHCLSLRKFLLLPAVHRHSHRKRHPETASLSLPAFHSNFTAHAIYQILDYGHAQARTFDFTDGSIVYSLKGKKNSAQKILTHSYSIVFTQKFQHHRILLRLAPFPILRHSLAEPSPDTAVFQSIFYCISDYIYQNLT